MTVNNVDAGLLARFVPLDTLPAEALQRLTAQARIETLPAKQVLFREGANDNDALFLIEGEVALTSSRESQPRLVKGATDEARYALANLKPRLYTGTVTAPARVLRVDAGLLDQLLTWDQMAGIEVVEIDGGEWMHKLLSNNVVLRMPPAGLDALLARFEEVPMKSGQLVIRQGQPGDYYYVIKQGRVRVMRKPENAPATVLAELVEGDAFGEEALLSNAPRNATVAALTDGALLRLGKADFDKLLRAPALGWVSDKDAMAMVAQGAMLVDVRLEAEHRRASIRGSLSIPLAQLRERAGELDRGRRIIVYCDTGNRSAAAAFLLSERGYDVVVLRNGLNALLPPGAAA